MIRSFRLFRVIAVEAIVVVVGLTHPLLAQRDTTITIKANGSTLEFVPDRIAVKAGTRLTLHFVNEGTYAHSVVVPKKDDDIDALAEAAVNAGESGFVPMAMK